MEAGRTEEWGTAAAGPRSAVLVVVAAAPSAWIPAPVPAAAVSAAAAAAAACPPPAAAVSAAAAAAVSPTPAPAASAVATAARASDTSAAAVPASGGALFNAGGTVTISNSTITGNTAQGGSGAYDGYGYGGGIFNLNGTFTATNVTIANNTVSGATANGGAFYSYSSGTVIPGISGTTATLNFTNSIFANSTGGNDQTFAGLRKRRARHGQVSPLQHSIRRYQLETGYHNLTTARA